MLAEDDAPLERHAASLGQATNNVAEWTALLQALALASERGANDVEILADSELVVKQMRGEYKVRHPDLQPLHAQAVASLKAFRAFRIAHIPREKNKEADRLVNRALDALDREPRAPSSIHEVEPRSTPGPAGEAAILERPRG